MKLHLESNLDVQTSDFSSIRWIDDRKGIKKQTKTWDRIIVNRECETRIWARYIRKFLHRGEVVYVYANNHYAGFGPGSIALFQKLWNEFP